MSVAAWLTLVAFGNVLAQDTASLPTTSSNGRLSYGAEVAFSSGHADRGFILADRPVVQPVLWLSGRGAELSVWGNLPLAETTDGLRPEIMEMELTRKYAWGGGKFRVAPAVRMFFYRDALSFSDTRSVEGWLTLSYDLGRFRLFTNQSIDLMTYQGAYFGEVGIMSERRVSPRLEMGGSLAAGWASATFNQAYAGVARSALDRLSVEGWVTTYVRPRLYIGPQVELSTIVDRAVRAELMRPAYVVVRLTTGAEF
jgi:hypothetical protein